MNIDYLIADSQNGPAGPVPPPLTVVPFAARCSSVRGATNQVLASYYSNVWSGYGPSGSSASPGPVSIATSGSQQSMHLSCFSHGPRTHVEGSSR